MDIIFWATGRQTVLDQISNWLAGLTSRPVQFVAYSGIIQTGISWIPVSQEVPIRVTIDKVNPLPLTEDGGTISFTIDSTNIGRGILKCPQLALSRGLDVLVIYPGSGFVCQNEVGKIIDAQRVVISNNQSPNIPELIMTMYQ